MRSYRFTYGGVGFELLFRNVVFLILICACVCNISVCWVVFNYGVNRQVRVIGGN